MNKNQWIVFLSFLVVLGFAWGFYQAADGGRAVSSVENSRARAFYDLTDSVEKLSVMSDKALISNGDGARARLFSQISTEAYVAQENLSQLPLYHETLLRTEQFLNQMGDFSYSLIATAAGGKKLSEDQYATLTSLNEEVDTIASSLHELAAEQDNPFSWRASKAAARAFDENDTAAFGVANTALTEVNSGLNEVPALIYDGPFSDHLESKGPVVLPGTATTWEDAIALAKKLFGNDVRCEKSGRSSDSAGIAVLTLEVTQGARTGWLHVSQSGCYPVEYTAYSEGTEVAISPQDGLKLAADFLQRAGFNSMRDSYYLIEGTEMTANFIYAQDDVVFYPDMVKVSVDLADGSIIGFDAINYLTNHKDRKKPALTLTAESAAGALTPSREPNARQKAVIPLPNGEEAWCHEFRFDSEEQSWLVYIDATTGEEANILGVYTTENGTFTM